MADITLTGGLRARLPSHAAVAAGNCGVPGVWRFSGDQPGRHAVVTCLIHGNEVAGAAISAKAIASGIELRKGSLTIIFCNLEAYRELNDANKLSRRWCDEDMNRVWSAERLNGAGGSYEARRAREILPFILEADAVLDLHSMHTPGPALGLVGSAPRNIGFANAIGVPELLVSDRGHSAGRRLIDLDRFTENPGKAMALLIECGYHFSRIAFDVADLALRNLMLWIQEERPEPTPPQPLFEVTESVTIQSNAFVAGAVWENMACVAAGGTAVAVDGERTVTTPYDDAWLVMPAPQWYSKPGMTAVRFARRIESSHRSALSELRELVFTEEEKS